MKTNTHTGLVIEFVGLPGAGKTTICDAILSSELHKEINIRDFKSFKKFFYKKSLMARIGIIFLTSIKKSPTFITFAFLLVKQGIISFDSFFRFYKLAIFQSVMTQFIKLYDVDLFILDQWSIQQLWSATIFRANRYDHLAKQLSHYYYEPDVLVYLEVDPKVADLRITGRASMKSRFDKMDTDKRADNLHIYNSFLIDLYNESTCHHKLHLSGAHDLSVNVDHLIVYLRNSLLTSEQVSPS